MSDEPTLWQIDVSLYSEKARWALAHKAVPHKRRSPPPGAHIAVALALTRGRHKTFPILQMDGRTIPDSTAIIAALEERHPEPRLYPEDPEQRIRALELEDYFDEELGPAARLLPFHELGKDPEAFEALVRRSAPPPMRWTPKTATRYARTYTRLRFGVADPDAAAEARRKIVAAFDRLEAELGDGEYLVGDEFTVADLTAASLFNPIVLPAEGPVPNDVLPAGVSEFREPLRERAGFRWVEEMFRRHRRRQAVAA